MTAWPTALKAFTDLVAGVTLESVVNVNPIYDEVEAMQLSMSQTALFAGWVNVQTLSANKTLVDTDVLFQSLNPNGSDRDVTLPALGSGNHAFVIANSGGANVLTVKNPAAATLAILAAGDAALFASDGVTWRLSKIAASATQPGIVELATSTEIDTGTDATRAMPVDQFVASKRNVKHIEIRLVDATVDVEVAASKGGDFRLPSVTGTIVDVGAYHDTAGVTGDEVVDIHLAGTTIMTTNKITTATAQKSSEDGGATQPALTTTAYTANAILTFDVDSIQTTPAKGLVVWLDIRES